MTALRLLCCFLVAAAAITTAKADETGLHCLNREQRRAAVADHRAVPLATAFKAIHGRVHGEVVRASLCESPKGLVYVLTLLARSGKVTRATVEASSGTFIAGR